MRRLCARLDTQMVWLTLVGALLLVGVLYGRAVGFSFLFDDTIDLPRVEGRGYLSLLTSSEGYSYYRPGPFLIWKLSHDLLGYYSEPLLHTLTLVFHALAGWLLYLLVSRLGAGKWAILPAILFLTYPFSYQDVAVVGTIFHPLAAAAILASLNLFLAGRMAAGHRAVWLHCLALLATVVALWSHESGVVVAPLVVGLEALILWQRRQRRPSWWTQGHIVATLGFVLTWFTVEKTPFGETATLGDMHPKALFFAQGLTYPLSAQIKWVDASIGWAPGIVQVTLLSLAFVLGVYLLAWWRTREPGELALARLAFPIAGLGIASVSALPAMARLSWPYVQDAPRLLYLGGIGAALFWGLLPALHFGRSWVTVLWRIATIGLLVGVVVQSWVFIDLRMEMFASGTDAVNGIVAAGDRQQGRGILVVNAPSWLAQPEYEYPYGHLGVQVIPTYIGLDRVIYTSSRQAARIEAASIALNPDVGGGRFTFGPHGAPASYEEIDELLRDGRVVVDVRRDGDSFVVREIGRMLPGRAEATAFSEAIDGAVVVSGLRSELIDGALTVYLSWNVLADVDGDPLLAVEIVDENGQVVARYEGFALGGTSAPRLWRRGDRIDDAVVFAAPPAGRYTISAGFAGKALTAVGEIGVHD